MIKTRRNDVTAFVTKDGSVIRELMHPAVHGNQNQSLAEAIVPPGQATIRHVHYRSEEIYHITAGRGRMSLGEDEFEVRTGDTICIPPGIPHGLINTDTEELVLLCSSSPPYDHDDTELLIPEA